MRAIFAISTLAFDVYGTLIDTMGVTEALARHLGGGDAAAEAAAEFARQWRAKQLEYAYRRGLMQDYVGFSECTRAALDHTNGARGAGLSDAAKDELMTAYGMLPAYSEAADALAELGKLEISCWAFSNGEPEKLEALLSRAGLRQYFVGVVSVAEVQSFKPAPQVYRHFLARAGSAADSTMLVSSNPFDVLGALNCGWRACWLQRNADEVFDPWGREPTVVLPDLGQLGRWLQQTKS